MKSERLRDALCKSAVDLKPTTQSQIAKWMKQKQRRKSGPELHLDPITVCVVDSQYPTVDLTAIEDDQAVTDQKIVCNDFSDRWLIDPKTANNGFAEDDQELFKEFFSKSLGIPKG